MNIYITGAAGFLGSHLADYFLEMGHDVYGADNHATGVESNLSLALGSPRFHFVKTDVIDPIPENLPSFDVILHFACPASPADYIAQPELTMKVDSIGTLHLLDRAKQDGAVFVMASTSEVYGDPLVHPQHEGYYGNVSTLGPRAVYDEAKRFSEAACMMYRRYQSLDARIVRIFNTYGPRMRLNDGRVVPNFIAQALRGEPLTIYGDGSQTRSFCFVSDLVRGVYDFATMTGPDEFVINLGNPSEFTVLQFAELVSKQCSRPLKIQYMPLPEDDPKQRRPDITRAMTLLNWKPEIDIENGLQHTIDFFAKLV
jgi:nucleoside-diphosphate-sugar epimerase